MLIVGTEEKAKYPFLAEAGQYLKDQGFTLEQFGVVGVPTIVFIDVQGREVQESRVVGYLGPDDFLQKVKRALGI